MVLKINADMHILQKYKWELAAPFMGGLLTLAFAPYDYAYTALPALMFLYAAASVNTVKRALWVGYLFGLGLYGSGIWWVYISIHEFGEADVVSSALLTALLVGVWAWFPAITAVLAAKILSLAEVKLRLMLAALLWVAVEYFRGAVLLNGFPWLQIAYSQLATPLAGYVPVLGVYGTGFLLAMSAFVLVEVWKRQLAIIPGLLLWVLIWSGGESLKRVQWTQAVGAPIQVTLVQGNISQDKKWLPNQRLQTMRLYQELTEQHWDSPVIIWPETAIPAFLSQVQEFYLNPLAAQAKAHHVDLVVSLPSSGEAKQYFNSVLALGERQVLYHKNHLLPFGEYLPLQPLSGWILDLVNIPLGDFTAGADRQELLTAGGYAFVTTICYEDAFGEQVNRQIEQAAFIVNVTNDAWFGASSEPYQHMQMAQMRALETGRFLLRATNTGLTGFVGPDGRLFKQAPMFTTTTLTDSIIPMGGMTPYARFGDGAVFGVISGAVALGFAVRRFTQRRSAVDSGE